MDELKKENSKSFYEWFNKNYDKENITNQLREAAAVGNKFGSIEITEDKNERNRVMKQDSKFLEEIKKMLPDLNVELETYSVNKFCVFSMSYKEHSAQRVVISWE